MLKINLSVWKLARLQAEATGREGEILSFWTGLTIFVSVVSSIYFGFRYLSKQTGQLLTA